METILVEVDRESEMARVSLNGECIMEGNFWDFHPGCHGINKFGDFTGYRELSGKIYQHLIRVKRVDFRQIKTIRQSYDWCKENNYSS